MWKPRTFTPLNRPALKIFPDATRLYQYLRRMNIRLHQCLFRFNILKNLSYGFLCLFYTFYQSKYRAIGLMSRVFANDLGDRRSIPGWVIPKTQKLYLMPLCLKLSSIRYGSREEWNNPREWVALFPTSRCSSYWKESFRVTLDCGFQLHLSE